MDLVKVMLVVNGKKEGGEASFFETKETSLSFLPTTTFPGDGEAENPSYYSLELYRTLH